VQFQNPVEQADEEFLDAAASLWKKGKPDTLNQM
jgi:hypothetical protein